MGLAASKTQPARVRCLFCGDRKPERSFKREAGRVGRQCYACAEAILASRRQKRAKKLNEFVAKKESMDRELRRYFDDVCTILARTYHVLGGDGEIGESEALRRLVRLSRQLDPEVMGRVRRRKLPALPKYGG